MPSWLNIVLAALPIGAAATAIFFIRQNKSGKKPTSSEILLFICAAITIVLINSVGFILQYYFEQLINWSSYNIHDLLLGPKGAYFQDDWSVIVAALPYASICCVAALSAAHFQRTPFTFFLTVAVFFFATTTISDAIRFLLRISSALSWEVVAANAAGAPFIAIAATIAHFSIAKAVHKLKPFVRASAILVLTASQILIFLVAMFVLERVFLLPSPTYFEATLSNRDHTSMFLAPPVDAAKKVKMMGAFDPLSAPHQINNQLEYTDAKDAVLNWEPDKKLSKVQFEAYKVSNCTLKLCRTSSDIFSLKAVSLGLRLA